MGRSEREEKIFFFVAHLRNRKRKKCCKWTRHNKKYARAIEEKIVLKKHLVACVSRRPSRSERPKTTEGNFFPPTIFSSVRIFSYIFSHYSFYCHSLLGLPEWPACRREMDTKWMRRPSFFRLLPFLTRRLSGCLFFFVPFWVLLSLLLALLHVLA